MPAVSSLLENREQSNPNLGRKEAGSLPRSCFHQYCCAQRCASIMRTTLLLGAALVVRAFSPHHGVPFASVARARSGGRLPQQLGGAGKNTNSQHASGLRGGESHTRLPSLAVEFEADRPTREEAKTLRRSNDSRCTQFTSFTGTKVQILMQVRPAAQCNHKIPR